MKRQGKQASWVKDGWVPIRKGLVYCSPLCGGGCTYTAYKEAVKKSNDLASKLGAGDWKPVVWENLGWHWKVRNNSGQLSIGGDCGRDKSLYHAMISMDGGVGFNFDGYGKTPAKAIKEALVKLRFSAAYHDRALAEVTRSYDLVKRRKGK